MIPEWVSVEYSFVIIIRSPVQPVRKHPNTRVFLTNSNNIFSHPCKEYQKTTPRRTEQTAKKHLLSYRRSGGFTSYPQL